MTTRGYDSRAITMPKSIKRQAARILDNHKRGAFLLSWKLVFEMDMLGAKQRRDKKI